MIPLFLIHVILYFVALIIGYTKDDEDYFNNNSFYSMIPFLGLWYEINYIVSSFGIQNFNQPKRKSSTNPTISYEQFQDFFLLKSEAWELNDSHTCFIYKKDYTHKIAVNMNKRDFKKALAFYNSFIQDKNNKIVEKTKNENYVKLLKYIQQDIEDIRKKSDKEIEEANKTSRDVAKRLVNIEDEIF